MGRGWNTDRSTPVPRQSLTRQNDCLPMARSRRHSRSRKAQSPRKASLSSIRSARAAFAPCWASDGRAGVQDGPARACSQEQRSPAPGRVSFSFIAEHYRSLDEDLSWMSHGSRDIGKVAVGTRFGGKPFKLNLTGLHTSRFSGLDPKSRVCKSWAAGWGDRNLDHPRLGLPRDQLVHAAVRNQCVG